MALAEEKVTRSPASRTRTTGTRDSVKLRRKTRSLAESRSSARSRCHMASARGSPIRTTQIR